jgi:type II secretory pathway pseudopilin PulG
LIELVIAIVIFAVAGAAIASLYTGTTKSSADPQIRAQGRSIAEAYMDEILLQRYCEDPDNDCNGETSGGGSEEGGSDKRTDFDDVWDYVKITNQSPPEDQNGVDLDDAAFDQIAAYTVSVTVAGDDPQAGPPFPTATITVTVEHDSGKLNYELVSEREHY